MKLSDKAKLFYLTIGSFIVSTVPLMVVFGMNWGQYTKTPEETTKLCFGGIIVLFFIFLKLIGKLKMPPRVGTFAIVCLLSYLLESVLDDLCLLSGVALIGEALDLIIFQRKIKELRERIKMNKQADIIMARQESLMDKYEGRG